MPGSVSQRLPSAAPAAPRAPAPAVTGDWRDHFGVWALVGGAALAAIALGAPAFSPSRPADLASALAAAGATRSALWLALAHLAALAPFDDARVGIRFISMAGGAGLAVALLWHCVRDGHRAHVAGRAVAATLASTLAAIFSVLTVFLSRAPWRATTSVGPTAIGALLTVVTLLLAERIVRRPADRRCGLALGLVAGLSVGGPIAAAALGWPLSALVVARASRRGERWPAPAAAIFVVAAALSLAAWAGAPGPSGMSDLAGQLFLTPVVRALGHLSLASLARAATELGDQIGILGLLVAATGLPRLGRTSLVFTMWPLACGLALRAVLGAGAEGTIGLIVAATALALPLGAGIDRLAARLGRAALPAVVVIGVVVATWPLLAK